MATKSKTTTKAKTKKAPAKKASTKKTVSKKPVAKVSASKVSKNNKSRAGNLKNWNIILAVLFLLQSVAILVIGKAVTVPVVNHYLAKDSTASDAAGKTVLAPAVRTMFNIDLRYIIFAFLFISVVYYILIATVRRQQYEDGLKNKTNKMRWIQQGITAGLMLVLIALLNGVYDGATLIAVFVLVGFIHFLGYFGEAKITDLRSKIQLFVAVCVAGATTWLIVAASLKGALFYGQGLSKYVYWIDGVIFLITLGLTYNKWQSMNGKGKWADYIYSEKIYIILGFLAQTILAWLVFAGFLT